MNHDDLVNLDDLKQVQTRLEAVLAKVPFLHEITTTTILPDELRVAIDGKWTLLVLHRPKAFPREVAAIHDQLNQRMAGCGRSYGVVSAPFLSEETSSRLHERGLGTIDLSGNHHLCFGTVFIEATGKENRFKAAKEVRNIFAPKAQRILRLLLQDPLRHWNGKDLASQAQVSQGLVSSIRQDLIAREWVRADPEGLVVVRPRDILKAWGELDRWVDRTEVHEFSSILPKGEILNGLSALLADQRHAYTQWTASELRRPETASDIVTAYVGKLPKESALKERLLTRPLDKNGNLRLVIPDDPGVFLGGRIAHGFPLVGDAQLWLDLVKAGNRGDEQALALWNWDGFGGWNR